MNDPRRLAKRAAAREAVARTASVGETLARGDEPEHLHYDLRFLLVSGAGEVRRSRAESLEVRWFTASELESIPYEETLHRLARKAAVWLAGD